MTDLLTSGARTGLTVADRARENRFFVRRLLAGKQPDFAAALEAALAEVALAVTAEREALPRDDPGTRFVSF
jgi:hypothetical protein